MVETLLRADSARGGSCFHLPRSWTDFGSRKPGGPFESHGSDLCTHPRHTGSFPAPWRLVLLAAEAVALVVRFGWAFPRIPQQPA